MMYCPECSAVVEPEDIFCGNCGMALTPVKMPDEDKNAFAGETSASKLPEITAKNETSAGQISGGFEHLSPAPVSATGQNLPSAFSGNQPPEAPGSIQIIEPVAELSPEIETAKSATAESETAEKEAVENLLNLPENQNDSSQNDSTAEIENAKPQFGGGEKTDTENFQTPEKTSGEITAVLSQPENVLEMDPAEKNEEKPQEKNQEKSQEIKAEEEIKIEENSRKTKEISPLENPPPAVAGSINGDSRLANQDILPEFVNSENSAPQSQNENIPLGENEGIETKTFEQHAPPAENHEAVKMPENPVGSSMYGSVEPTLVSVQIYEPQKTPNAEAGAAENLKQNAEDKVSPEIKPEIKPEAVSAKAQSPTSPNIGGSDTDGRAKAKLRPLDEGTVLNNRYEIVRKIGGGGMGAVYLASDRNLGGVLRAVKEMVQSYIEDAQQEKAVGDFRRESLLLTSLEHHSIPTIYDYFYDEKECRFYLVMKYISGGDLAGRLRSASEGRIDEPGVTEWAIQIADVLDYLHNRQPPIVYRDLKPSNIMIDGNSGRVMLIDFGIARWVNKEEKGVTAVGTMGYAPPELFSGNVEPRSDIYSLGSTMFHLLTGADPQSNPLLIFDFHKNPRPRQINPQLTDQMEQILMKSVEYNSNERFSSAAEMRDVLAKHLENLRAGAVTYGVGSRLKTEQSAGNLLVFCGFCGQKVLATDVFCPFCGAQQPLAGQKAKSAPPAFSPSNTTARLIIAGTNELAAPVFDLEKEQNLVGRRDPMSNIFPEVDLSKFDPQTKISRRHARIWRDNDRFMVEDLGSSNGTILITKTKEPERLPKNQPRVLTHGDKIRVGDTTLNFVVG